MAAGSIFKGGIQFIKGGIRVASNLRIAMSGSGAPTNGTSGTGASAVTPFAAGPGSVYINTATGDHYTNFGTAASPSWVPTTSVSLNSKVLAATATFTSNSVLTNLTGFSWPLVAGATYLFDINLPATMTTNGGLSVAFKYTTATLTSIQAQTYAATASDNTTAVSTQSTTTTDATKYFDSKTAAYTLVTLKGTMVVNAAGSVAIQVAQNTSNTDTTSVLLGGYATFRRVL